MKFDTKNYYKAKEAQEKLGVDKNRFNYLVRTERIKKYIPPGKTQGEYLKSEIDKLARELMAYMTYEEKGLEFAKAKTNEDIEEEYALASLLFGNATHGIEIRHKWLEKNPDSNFIVRDHGRLVGFIELLITDHESIQKFIDGKIRGWEIENALPFENNTSIECIVMAMGTSPEVEVSKRRQYGAKAISGFIDFLCEELAPRHITITKFYATSSTPTGIAILKNADFSEVGQIGKRIAFELDTTTSSSKIAIEYRKALEENPLDPPEKKKN